MRPEELPRQVRDRITFLLERFLVRGVQYRLLVIAAMIVLLSLIGGALVMVGGRYDAASNPYWWAFLRLSDPGYLGDDEGLWRRTVAIALTVMGYVVFVGALVATMSQWLNATLERLQLGLTPIRMRGHVVILGWTDRTPDLIKEMILSEGRLRRWLQLRGVTRLRLAVLADRVTPALMQELRDELGAFFHPSQIILRSGSSLRFEHLDRVDVAHASAVVVPGSDFTGKRLASQDARTVKVLLTVSAMLRQLDEPPPTFVGELYDHRTIGSARGAYPGRVELVATEGLVGRMLASCIRQPGMSSVHHELLTHGEGSSLYIRTEHPFDGTPWVQVCHSMPRAITLGVVRGGDEVHLNPAPDFEVTAGDQIVVLSRNFEDTEPIEVESSSPVADPAVERVEVPPASLSRILVLGWNRKAPSVLAELDRFGHGCRVNVVSTVPDEDRLADIEADGVTLTHLDVVHQVADYTDPGKLARLQPQRFERILLLSSDWLASRDEADARTIACYLLLSDMLRGRPDAPSVLVELTDPDDAVLLRKHPAEVLSTPRLVSHILAQVVLRQELHGVILELLGGGGPDVMLVSAQVFGLRGELTFAQIAQRVRAAGQTLLGVRLATTEKAELNPPPQTRYELGPDDGLVIIG